MGVRDRFDPEANLSAGADYLARLLLKFGDLRLALAAFNAGPARVAQLGRVPDIAETRAYVGSVINCYLALAAGHGVRSARECAAPGAQPQADPERDEDLLTRSEASEYLARFHIRMKPATLARIWSVGGDGPPCRHIRGKPWYPAVS